MKMPEFLRVWLESLTLAQKEEIVKWVWEGEKHEVAWEMLRVVVMSLDTTPI